MTTTKQTTTPVVKAPKTWSVYTGGEFTPGFGVATGRPDETLSERMETKDTSLVNRLSFSEHETKVLEFLLSKNDNNPVITRQGVLEILSGKRGKSPFDSLSGNSCPNFLNKNEACRTTSRGVYILPVKLMGEAKLSKSEILNLVSAASVATPKRSTKKTEAAASSTEAPAASTETPKKKSGRKSSKKTVEPVEPVIEAAPAETEPEIITEVHDDPIDNEVAEPTVTE